MFLFFLFSCVTPASLADLCASGADFTECAPVDTGETAVIHTDETDLPVDTDETDLPIETDWQDTDTGIPPDTDETDLPIDTDLQPDTDVPDTDLPVDTGDTASGDSGESDSPVETGDTGDTDPGYIGIPNGDPDVDDDGDGYAERQGDCDDFRADVRPGAVEACDGADNDCDSVVDDGALTTYYRDVDADHYGDSANSVIGCSMPLGYAADGGDCDDRDPDFHPLAPETCTDPSDYNCDGTVGFRDDDGDGYAACTDCNDASASVHPGAAEVCNGADEDCDNVSDDGVLITYYVDQDSDGHGDAATSVMACSPPTGYVTPSDDCDDAVSTTHPGATETCNGGVDDDCDGGADDLDNNVPVKPVWCLDYDGDSYCDGVNGTADCDGVINSAAYPHTIPLSAASDRNSDGNVDCQDVDPSVVDPDDRDASVTP